MKNKKWLITLIAVLAVVVPHSFGGIIYQEDFETLGAGDALPYGGAVIMLDGNGRLRVVITLVIGFGVIILMKRLMVIYMRLRLGKQVRIRVRLLYVPMLITMLIMTQRIKFIHIFDMNIQYQLQMLH